MNLLLFALISMLSIAYGVTIKKLDDPLMHSPEHHQISKRQAPASKGAAQNSARQNDFYDFVEEKLVQHSQALEHLVKLSDQVVSTLNNLAENLGRGVEEPKLPERFDVKEEIQERSGKEAESRRSYWGKPFKWPSLFNSKRTYNAWCSVAVLCHRTRIPVCGYDDSYGYGKFDDLCHLIQVNCYWNYNFALVPGCKSAL